MPPTSTAEEFLISHRGSPSLGRVLPVPVVGIQFVLYLSCRDEKTRSTMQTRSLPPV